MDLITSALALALSASLARFSGMKKTFVSVVVLEISQLLGRQEGSRHLHPAWVGILGFLLMVDRKNKLFQGDDRSSVLPKIGKNNQVFPF